MHPSDILEKTLRTAKKFIPRSIFSALQPHYHRLLALAGAVLYRFPAKRLFVIGVTGTKGKTSTSEVVNSILEAAGKRTALAGTLRFKVGETSWNNMYKMTMPGRLFLQQFLRKAADAGCEYAIVEMTSEGSKQHRYDFTFPDAFVFTNLSPEHIESHGSYENYVEAKVDIGRLVRDSKKPRRIAVVNGDDAEAGKFLALGIPETFSYHLRQAAPYEAREDGVEFTYDGTRFESGLPGLFNIQNILAALTLGKALGLDAEAVRKGVRNLSVIRGRMERVEIERFKPLREKQDFTVIVDYAHTPDSLEKAYKVFEGSRRVCVLGGTGGGRDTWKRKVMGGIADSHCDEIILTDEDPYDEDPDEIVKGIAEGITKKQAVIEMDRRKAIRLAIEKARSGDVVLITGKGTDPFICGPAGSKTPWSDSAIAKEELEAVLEEREHARTA